ncbi:hypothetical protein [Algoriphagus sp.]|uniref:hypothetical protein n=1 Tax=Algoriphagus sp. TaxID=1872435 RepID=UPI003919128D
MLKKRNKLIYIRSILLILILGNFSISHSYSQNLKPNSNFFGQYTLEHWDINSGLPSDLVLSAFQSSDGFIWLTGYTGLIRFDGVTFTSFTTRNVPLLESDNISAVTESSDSTLWITTGNTGLLNYKHGVFQQFIPNIRFRDFIATTKTGGYLLSQNNALTPFIIVDTNTGDFKNLTLNERDSLFINQTLHINRRTDSKGGI